MHGGPAADYARPRLFMGKSRNENFQIKGQSYSVTRYDDLMAIAENEYHNLPKGLSHNASNILRMADESIAQLDQEIKKNESFKD